MISSNIPLGIYQHYKGNKYRVLGTALHSETLETLVVYQALYAGEHPLNQLWVRPAAMFLETIEYKGNKRPRFTHCEHETL